MKRGRPRKNPLQQASVNENMDERKINESIKEVNEVKVETNQSEVIESAEKAELIAEIIRNQVEEVNKLLETAELSDKEIKCAAEESYKSQANFDDTWTKMFNLWSCGW